MGAIGGAVGGALAPGGLTQAGAFTKVGSSFAQGALRGAVSSLATQGIGVATGLQKNFSWLGVATAALGGGISNSVSRSLIPAVKDGLISSTMADGLGSGVSAMANAAARSLITGTSFGDNLIAALPDVIGGTIGNMIGNSIAGDVQGSGSKGKDETEVTFAPKAKGPSYDDTVYADTPRDRLQKAFGASATVENASFEIQEQVPGDVAPYLIAPQETPPDRENPEIASYLERNRGATERYSRALGVPPSAVEGVIGEEMRNVRAGETWLEDNALQVTRDATRLGGTEQTVIEEQDQMYRSSIESGRPIGGNSTLGRYTAKASGIILAQDIGVANINFGESIRLLKEYYAAHPRADPLNLRIYRRDYTRLYNDLRSPDSDVSIRFAALKVRDVIDSFNADPRIRASFSRLDARGRDAAIDAGYRTLIGGIQARVRRDRPIYVPREGTYDYFYSRRSPYNYAPYRPTRGR